MNAILSKMHKLVLVPECAILANLFPTAPVEQLPAGKFHILPHGLAETRLLRTMGVQLPSPILSHYDWAGGTPFEAQRQTCDMLTLNERAYVLNDLGTGKTKAALWAWDYLNKQGLAGKLLVSAPLSTISFVWAREVLATIPHRKVAVLHGDRKKRYKILKESDADIFVINHEGLAVLFPALMAAVAKGAIDSFVIDELAMFRNGQAIRTRRAKDIASKMKWVWGMTGEPIPNEPTDVWAQASIVTPHTVPKYFSHLREQLMVKVSNFIWRPKPDAIENAFKCLQPAVRFTLDDVVELPEIIERDIDVEMNDEQKRVYQKLARDLYAQANAKEITAANAGAMMIKLLQVAGGYVYASDADKTVLDLSPPRVTATVEAVESAARKVLVLVPFRHALQGVSDGLTKAKISHGVVHGDTVRREEIFHAFQSTTMYKALVAHPGCLAHGLTLTAADTIIWYLPLASLETYAQANARIRRYGQKHKQQIIHLVGTPVEKRLYSLLRAKERVQDKFLTMFEDKQLMIPDIEGEEG